MFFESIDRGIWYVVINGTFVLMFVTNNVHEEKKNSL